ncbi:hypothetical protein ACOJTA_08510 [Malaciobacter sp. WC5094]
MIEELEGKKGMKKLDLEVKKEVAKIGMTATLGATVVTSMFMKNKLAKKTHVIAGAAFCGFALWHHLLYQPENKQKKKLVKKESKEEIVLNDNL